MIDIQSAYIAAGGNRHPAAADWDSRSGLLAYGSDQNLALWDPLQSSNRGVDALLHGHTAAVNAVKFFPTESGQPHILLSGSADKTIRVWRLPQSTAPPEQVTVLEGHAKSVNCLAVFPTLNIVASGSADGTVKIWRFSSVAEGFSGEDIQTIHLSPQCLPLSLALHALDSTSPNDAVLAVGGTRSTVQIFVSDKHTQFSHQIDLTGHDGWIRSLAFSREDESWTNDVLLASASQDKYIRVWRISRNKNAIGLVQLDLQSGFEQSLSNKAHRLYTTERSYTVTFEALLLGHEDWIYTVSWCLKQEKLQLLSASEDNSLAIWEREEISGVWVPVTRLGEISSLKGSTTATGSTGGFWIGLWSPTGKQVVSLGRTGSWRFWKYDQSKDGWLHGIGISGHIKPVMDIAWSDHGSYLLSTGSDQTTRLHAEWKRGFKRSWHEMARPQIHGYDLNCIDSIGGTQFVSGADEKLLRVFDEPRTTAGMLEHLCGIRTEFNYASPESADIPVLGLSNKATEIEADGESSHKDGAGFNGDNVPNVGSPVLEEKTSVLGQLPTEDRLARHTLWPEREKLYGHGHEISAVAVSPKGNVVATACKASSQDHAVVRLFTTKDWREIKPSLMAHSLTVTALRFSASGNHLLSVGRDRRWALWEISRNVDNLHNVEDEGLYRFMCSNPKGHSRMILNADWAPTSIGGGRIFCTAGRDKCVKIWTIDGADGGNCVATIAEMSAITAVAIAPKPVGSCMMVALGTETGTVSLHLFDPSDWGHRHKQELGEFLQPSKSVTQLAWRPSDVRNDETRCLDENHKESFQLAIASEDSSLRLLHIICDGQSQFLNTS